MLDVNRSHISGLDNDGAEIWGNPDSFFGQSILAFADLLGFTATTWANWGDGEDAVLAKLVRIKKHTEGGQKGGIAIAADSGTPPKAKRHYRRRVHTVSDSFIVSSALPYELSSVDLIYAFAGIHLCMRELWRSALREGFTIRGAIEQGPIYWTRNETIGPAFLNAYTMECSIAKWSRIIIGPSLLKFFANVMTNDPNGEITKLLGVSPRDGSIELRPTFDAEDIERIEKLAREAGANSEKYDALLAQVRGTEVLKPIGAEDCHKAIAKFGTGEPMGHSARS